MVETRHSPSRIERSMSSRVASTRGQLALSILLSSPLLQRRPPFLPEMHRAPNRDGMAFIPRSFLSPDAGSLFFARALRRPLPLGGCCQKNRSVTKPGYEADPKAEMRPGAAATAPRQPVSHVPPQFSFSWSRRWRDFAPTTRANS